jgi:AcrR family transcriptional regulator
MSTEPSRRSTGPSSGGPGSGRRRLPVQRRRDELIAVALELYSRSPGHQVSIEDVADAAGASRALVYHYFGGKHGLYVAALRTAAAQLSERLVSAPGEPPLRQLDLAVARYLDFVEGHEAGFAALLRSAGPHGDDEVGQIANSVRQTIFDRLVAGLGVTETTPVLRLTVRGWIAAAEAASLDWLDSRDVDRDVLHRLLTGQLAAMLATACGEDRVLADQLTPLLHG